MRRMLSCFKCPIAAFALTVSVFEGCRIRIRPFPFFCQAPAYSLLDLFFPLCRITHLNEFLFLAPKTSHCLVDYFPPLQSVLTSKVFFCNHVDPLQLFNFPSWISLAPPQILSPIAPGNREITFPPQFCPSALIPHINIYRFQFNLFHV